MKIEISTEGEEVNIAVFGRPGDGKQPINWMYNKFTISRTTALRVALALKQAAERQPTKRESVIE